MMKFVVHSTILWERKTSQEDKDEVRKYTVWYE